MHANLGRKDLETKDHRIDFASQDTECVTDKKKFIRGDPAALKPITYCGRSHPGQIGRCGSSAQCVNDCFYGGQHAVL